ncbi:hypothetical protein LY76DRAFT_590557 [Colletotrichum caudatum]|nr:hypothetical protein LY76DRAFT_590557 [Colletotrichum caudatum]
MPFYPIRRSLSANKAKSTSTLTSPTSNAVCFQPEDPSDPFRVIQGTIDDVAWLSVF